MGTKKKTAKKAKTGQLKLFKSKKTLSKAQRTALAKGQLNMSKAKTLQKQAGTKKKTIVAGGKTQTIEVYAINLNQALKKVSRSNVK